MTVLRAMTRSGPACALTIERPAEISIGSDSLLATGVRARLTVDLDEVVTTTTDPLVPIDDPLWPATESGYRLRRAFLAHGPTALVDLPDLAGHWCDTTGDGRW